MLYFNKRIFILQVACLCLFIPLEGCAQHVPFAGNKSANYQNLIEEYKKLATSSPIAELKVIGKTDVGKPLHMLVINTDQVFETNNFGDEKVKVLINNGIHPGEPCGIDASLMLVKELLKRKDKSVLENTILCIIPIYNVGGMLNRGCCSRANQNGPEEYGFRGNAKNLDLNRDFIKCDSENAKSFSRMYSSLRPHLFVDTHTSNGADYQYILTLIHSQEDKATERIGNYTKEVINPALYEGMTKRGYPMVPYVYGMGRTPEDGIKNFLETPRYSTGYSALFQSIGFVTETHMFKPFADRVESTYQFLDLLLAYSHENSNDLKTIYRQAGEDLLNQQSFALRWELDTNYVDSLSFAGYEPVFEESKLNGKERLRYDRDQPFTRNIPYYSKYKATVKVDAPSHYLIPQGWTEAIDRLHMNGVEMVQIENDTTMKVEVYYLSDVKTVGQPYEGHFLHQDVKVTKYEKKIDFFMGDWMISTDQVAKRYIVETLEPQGVDSFFAWGFFDSILQQKEWFSDYIFEEQAIEMLKKDKALKTKFEQAKIDKPDLVENRWAQLYWLYSNSEYFEDSYNRYPVYRL